MIKVGYLPQNQDDAASYYRMTGVLKYINHPEISLTNIGNSGSYHWATISGFDTIIIQRPSTGSHIDMINMIKDMNIRVISDWDDDLLNLMVHHNDSITFEDQSRNIKKCLSLCDEVWAATPAIKAAYKPFNRNIHVIPNCLNNYLMPLKDKMPFNESDENIASYRGGASHIEDVQSNVNDLVKTMETFPDWEFRFVGSGKEVKPGEWRTQFELLDNRTQKLKNHTFTMPCTLIQFFKVYFSYNAKIAFYPLVNHLFNAAKSNISMLEATYAGSCFMGNRLLNEFDLPFVIDISDGMYPAFMELKNDFERMERLNTEAWEYICDERLLSKVNLLRIERLLEHGTSA